MESHGVSIAPVGMTSAWTPQTYAHAADEDDIARVQGYYGEAAARAVDAGFDIVYVHAGHAVLTVQFFSPYFNKRTDRYGGSLENRARFWRESLEAVKKAAGDHCAIATRVSVDQLIGPGGIEAHGEDILRLIELFEGDGLVDVWDINIGDLDEWGEDAGPSRFYRANHQAPFTRHIRSHTKAPVVIVGRLTSPDDMLQVITSGQADITGAARPSIADPFLPSKIAEGRIDDIRECIGCNICIARSDRGGHMVCTQNPTSMEEYRRGWHPERFIKTKDRCWVLVVGAGPSGIECARVLGECGYDVHLLEAEAEIGGHLRDVMRYPGLAEWGRVVEYRRTHIAKLSSVDVHTGIGPMSADNVLSYEAEKIVLATGAAWAGDGFSHITLAPIPGADADLPQCLTPEAVMAGKEIGERVVVLDAEGHFVGVAMAELMADRGKEVTLVTPYPAPAPMTLFTLEQPNILRMLYEKGIAQRCHSWIETVEIDNAVTARIYDIHRDGYRRTIEPARRIHPRSPGTSVEPIACDSLILVTARIASDGLYRDLRARKEEWVDRGILGVYQIGDGYAPRQLAEAVFDGHRLAQEFESADP